jgi:hypothetical protein
MRILQVKVGLISLLLLSYFNIWGAVDIRLTPIEFTSTNLEERMDQLYDICDNNIVHIDSTVHFTLNGCTAPILISMDAMRSGGDPFDPGSKAKDEIIVMGPPYLTQFEKEGMYVIFCDHNFKSIATCLTITEQIVGLPSGGARTVPTLGEWGIILLFQSLIIIGLVFMRSEKLYLASSNN